MKPNEVRILLTGATGVVGREVFYELAEKFASGKLAGKILLLIRDSAEKTAQERAEELILHKFAPEYFKKFAPEFIKQFVEVIAKDISSFVEEDITEGNRKNLYVIHAAASTNLADTPKAEEIIRRENYSATLHLLETMRNFVHKFIFVSTAFATGRRSDVISDDYLNLEECDFRNHYERYKLKTEREVKEICRDKNIKYQIVRPSVVCGRLIHEPLYYTPKFNVFYLLGRFVMSYKNRLEPGQSVRLQLYRENTLNIVSSDFVAQVICDVMFKDDIEQINITAQNAVKIGKLLSYLPEDEQVKQFVFTESVVEDPNNIEKLYQKTVGEQITRYFVGDNMNFSPDFRQKVCPHLTEPEPLEYADGLVRFALEHEFADIG